MLKNCYFNNCFKCLKDQCLVIFHLNYAQKREASQKASKQPNNGAYKQARQQASKQAGKQASKQSAFYAQFYDPFCSTADVGLHFVVQI